MTYDFFRFGPLPMVMAPDEGDQGGGGGDPGAGDAGADKGNEGGDPGASDKGGDAGDQGGGGGEGGQGDPGADKGAGDKAAGDKSGDKAQDKGKGAEGGDKKPAEAPFPENWRERLATGADGKVDEKRLNILKRYTSPQDYANASFDLRKKIDSGEFKKPLSKDAKPEEVAAWRKDNGIPEKPEAYLEGLPDGVVFGEDDKAVLDPFLKDMHDRNIPPDAVHSALSAYHQAQAHQAEMIQARDLEIADNTRVLLQDEWGADYRPNINAVTGFIDAQFPADIKEALLNARLGDDKGTPLMHSPEILRAFASLGRVLNPQSTVTHGKGLDSMEHIETEISAIEAKMGDKNSDYWKGASAEKNQARYRELVTIRDRMRGQKQ